eukprot:scaffold133765_cov60-Attheya_sp.AAC.6
MLCLLARPWEMHLPQLGAVCPSFNHIIPIFLIKVYITYGLFPVIATLTLGHMQEEAFTGRLPKPSSQPFAYPRWMLVLTHYMLSNHTWKFWMLLAGFIIHPTLGHSVYHSKSARSKIWRPPWNNFGISKTPREQALFSSLNASNSRQHLNALHLDLEGFDIALDNCTTGHITCSKDDFIEGSFRAYPQGKSIEGVGGLTSATGQGSVKWMITDDMDQLHLFILHNVSYVPTSPLRLLSPQQLSFDLRDHKEQGTYITTYASDSHFVWHQRQYKKAVSHRWNCNIPIVRAGPIWNSALVQHVHEASSLPLKAIPTAYCCLLDCTGTTTY